MAEDKKKKNVKKQDEKKNVTKKNDAKKKDTKKKVNTAQTNKKTEEKKSLWVKFRIFCHGVKSEFEKVHWTPKSDMVKYSIATIVFIIFCSLFFYGIDVIFALIQSLFN